MYFFLLTWVFRALKYLTITLGGCSLPILHTPRNYRKESLGGDPKMLARISKSRPCRSHETLEPPEQTLALNKKKKSNMGSPSMTNVETLRKYRME